VRNSASGDDGQEAKLLKRVKSADDAAALLGDEGLCFLCQHHRLVRSPRSLFVRCALGSRDGSFATYPRLPVQSCSGFLRRGTSR